MLSPWDAESIVPYFIYERVSTQLSNRRTF